MKKKNLAISLMSVALVGVIAVGGTLAYLTANTENKVNTFQFADMEVTLTEEGEVLTPGGGDASSTSSGIDYTDLVPGADLKKNVDTSIDTDAEAYLFIKIDSVGDGLALDLGTQVTENGWTAYKDTVDANGYGEYYRTVKGSEDAQLFDVFENLTIPTDATGEVALNEIKISVKAIQTLGFDNVEAAYEECSYQS